MKNPSMIRLRPMLPAAVLSLGLACGQATAAPVVEKSVKLDAGLYELAVDPATGRVYVASAGSRTQPGAKIIVLDGATLERLSDIDVSATPVYGVGLNAAAGMLYGTATRNGSVTAVDVRSGKVVASIQHGEGAHVREAVADPRANRVYVSVVGSRDGKGESSAVWVIDGLHNAFVESIPVEAGTLTGVAVDPAGGRLFATAMGDNEVLAIDLAQKKVVSRWPAGGESPVNLVFDAAGHRLFVANQKSGSLTVLDARDGKLLRSVPTGEGALGVAFHPGRQQVYVANRQAGTLTVVDAKDYSVVANLQTGTLPQTIAVDAKNDRVFVSNKARGLPRNAPAGTAAPEDPAGDTVTLVRP
ncbi:MAG: YncE family protein [Steroidobacteraceae bacterium]